MNSDEIQSLVTKVAIAVLSSLAGGAAMSNSQVTAIASGIGALAAVGYGVYLHWGMKKVPETSIVVGKSQ